MEVTIIMVIGIIIGYNIFPKKLHKLNQYLQVLCVAILIFSMGVMLGNRENFLNEVYKMGFTSLVLALITIIFSVILVYFLTERYLKKNTNHSDKEEEKWL